MPVIPASDHVDLDRIKRLTGAEVVELATEREFKDAFPDSETGACRDSATSTAWRYMPT